MTWVMITKEPPPLADDTVEPARMISSPPRGSIHWAVASTIAQYAKRQQETALMYHAGTVLTRKGITKYVDALSPDFDINDLLGPDDYCAYTENPLTGGGLEPNWVGAMTIRWEDADVRIFPHEYSVCDLNSMQLLVYGDDAGPGAYDLMPASVAELKLVTGVLDGELRPIYEAALLDGCNHEQAVAVALEQDILAGAYEIPPAGWYRLKPEYAEIFCR